MKHITLIATPGVNLGSIDNPARAFHAVNAFLQSRGEAPLFTVQIAGMKPEIKVDNGRYTIHPDVEIVAIRHTDLIVVPAFDGDIQQNIESAGPFLPWMVHQYKEGAEIASLCVGAFLVAATGLLNGRSCSTHWRAAVAFGKLFPEVQLVTDKVITDERGIYTSGGAFSSANLILYIIEKYAGRDVAIHCAKIFQIDMDRHSQSPFIIFEGQKDHEDPEIRQAQAYIEDNYQEKISVDELSSMLALSRRNLERRFKKATTNTVVEYIQRVKIEAVKKLLETGRKTVNELMYEVGYNDPKSFRSLFKKYTGLSPVAYRNRYNKEAALV